MPENSEGAHLLAISTTLGATGGFALMYKNFSNKISINSSSNTSMNFSFNPSGLLNFTDYKFKNEYYPPLASFYMSF